MNESCENLSDLFTVPTDLLMNILQFIPAKDLMNCRLVCQRWKKYVNALSDNDELWKQYCVSDFKSIYKEARRKSLSCLMWFELYRCLTVWGRLRYVYREYVSVIENASADCVIMDSCFVNNGVIMINNHSKKYFGGVKYCHINRTSSLLSSRPAVIGKFRKFINLPDVAVYLSLNRSLHIIQKPCHKYRFVDEPVDERLKNITTFLIIDKYLYFTKKINGTGKLFHCNLYTEQIIELAVPLTKEIIILSNCNDCLHYMTIERCVYGYQNGEFVKLFLLDDQPNIFDSILRYNLGEQMVWPRFYKWLWKLKVDIPCDNLILNYISIMKQYGNTIFIGTVTGLLLIYHKPFTNGQIDLFNNGPNRLYDFNDNDQYDRKKQRGMNEVRSIDVFEFYQGHKIIVRLKDRVKLIEMIHSYLTHFAECNCNICRPYSHYDGPNGLEWEDVL